MKLRHQAVTFSDGGEYYVWNQYCLECRLEGEEPSREQFEEYKEKLREEVCRDELYRKSKN